MATTIRFLFMLLLVPVDVHAKHYDEIVPYQHWAEFEHPIIGFDIPILDPSLDEFSSLTGLDTNNNQIRDDYEVSIIMSNLSLSTKVYGLNAGIIYQQFIKVMSQKETEIDAERAYQMMSALIAVKQCNRELRNRASDKQTWRENGFFNTKARFIAKYRSLRVVSDSLTKEISAAAIKSPCETMMQYVQKLIR